MSAPVALQEDPRNATLTPERGSPSPGGSDGPAIPHPAFSIEALFRAHHAKLCAFACRYVDCPDTAQEIVAEVFLRLWEQRDRSPAWENPRSYLYTAVRNRALHHLEHQRVVQKSQLLGSGEVHAPGMSQPPTAADDQVHLTELHRALQNAISQLPARCREAYRLHREEGLSYLQVAETMEVSVRTVETQLTRATRVLRRNLSVWLL